MMDVQAYRIRRAIEEFPPTFGLRGFPGLTFKIWESYCYISMDKVMLYTFVNRGTSETPNWLAFAKATPEELRSEIVVQ
jgi:hypothetical protein